MCFPLNDMAECLDEPTALGGISPAVEARDSAVGDKKVGMAGDPVCGHTMPHRLHATRACLGWLKQREYARRVRILHTV